MSPSNKAMPRLSSLVLWTLLLPPLRAVAAPTTPVKPTTKKPAVTAAKRAKSTPPATVASRKTRTPATSSSRNENTATRHVVVTRKKVNGHWVRQTQVVHTPPPPSYQTQPDPDRYQKIQAALAERGFFKGEPNGEWKDDSVDALKRYQAASNLPDDGKINSLSLIGLGLGPKHDGSITPPAPAPAQPPI